jgi:CheY-like chemotaxis protein
LSRLLNDAVDSIRPAAQAKGVHLDVGAVTEADGIILRADPERLQQVFWNLLSNAVKFTPAGGRVTISIAHKGEGVEVAVSDTGAGLSPEFLPFAFDRFRQADQSFTRAQGGLGLGLAIVKHLIEMHGGEVTVASEGLTRGATFVVRLPVAERLEASTRAGDGDSSAALDAAGPGISERFILVVDDDAATRELLTTMLSVRRARVVAVDCARAAVAQLELEVPSVILADIGMPEEDGLSMIRRIRSREPDRGGAVPAIALSAYARAEDRQAALSAGFNDFLTKPAMPADIMRTLEQWLTKHA